MLRGSGELIDICRRRIAEHPHGRSQDGAFSWEEVECLGACVNAPMVQIGRDNYEDLAAETFEAVLDAFARGERPRPGPQVDRQTSAPITGLTTLTEINYAEDDRPPSGDAPRGRYPPAPRRTMPPPWFGRTSRAQARRMSPAASRPRASNSAARDRSRTGAAAPIRLVRGPPGRRSVERIHRPLRRGGLARHGRSERRRGPCPPTGSQVRTLTAAPIPIAVPQPRSDRDSKTGDKEG